MFLLEFDAYYTVLYISKGCISPSTPICIRRVEGRYGSQAYIDLLEDIVRPQLDFFSGNPNLKKRAFFHDNFPVHCCKAVSNWFNIPGITLISLPKNSPDLMPLLKISEKVVYELGKQGILASTKDELWDRVSRMFATICTQTYVDNLFSDIPNIVTEICESGGSIA